ALAGARVRIVVEQAPDSKQRLGILGAEVAEALGVALEAHIAVTRQCRVPACKDPAIVAEDAVHTGAARDLVATPAAYDVVIVGIAEGDVVAATEIDDVVTGFAVDLVVAADV